MARETPPHPWEHDITDTVLTPYFGIASIDRLPTESRIRFATISGKKMLSPRRVW